MKFSFKARAASVLAAACVALLVVAAAWACVWGSSRLLLREAFEELESENARNVSIASRMLAAILADLAWLKRSAEAAANPLDAFTHSLHGYQSARQVFLGAAVLDSQGHQLYSLGVMPRALTFSEAGESSWWTRLLSLSENEVYFRPWQAAGMPVMALAIRIASGKSGLFAVFAISPEVLLAELTMDKEARMGLLVDEKGQGYVLHEERLEQAPSSWKGLFSAAPQQPTATSAGLIVSSALALQAPAATAGGLAVAKDSVLGWRLALARPLQSLQQQTQAVAYGIWLLAAVLSAIASPLAYLGTRNLTRLAELRQQVDTILESSPGGLLAVREAKSGGKLQIERINPAAAEILRGPQAAADSPLAIPKKLEDLLKHTLASGHPITSEIQLGAPGERWVLVRAAPTKTGAVVALTDTTERRRQEEALRASEQSLQLASRMGKIGIWRVDLESKSVWWSPEVRRIHAVPDNYQPQLDSAFEFYTPESAERLRRLFDRCAQTGEEFDGEFEFRDARGKVLWVRVLGQAERDESTGQILKIFGTFQDITEFHESTIALAESRELLSVAFWGASLSIADWRMDTGEFIFDANLLKLLGYERHEVTPTLAFRDSLMPEEDRQRWAESLHAHLAGQAPFFEAEYRLRARDGSFRWLLERSKIAAVDASHQPVRLVGILTDITRLKEAERLVAEALDHEKHLAAQARAASEAKKDFLAMMSHEIRTPLNSILGFAEMLSAHQLDEEAADYVATIRESGESLLRILNDILDYSRIESGKLEVVSRAYNPAAVVQSVAGLLLPSARAKGISMDVRLAPNLPAAVVGDEVRVRQVLLNLAGNAVKFTSSGSVLLTLTMDDSRQHLRFSVKDTGPGIPKEKLSSIFEPFTQADASISRMHGGTGLGLAISSRLVQLMEGTIEVESTVGQGSTFSFTLPLKETSAVVPGQPAASAASASYAQAHPLKILIAEDDYVNARLTKLILNRLGYSPTIAADGNQAVSCAVENPPDLIFMDLRMPKMDGLEATRAIRAAQASGVIPHAIFVAALTADVLPEGREQSFLAGMDDYIPKPVSTEKILEILKKAEARKKTQDALATHQS